jgi:hypothetical protein
MSELLARFRSFRDCAGGVLDCAILQWMHHVLGAVGQLGTFEGEVSVCSKAAAFGDERDDDR